MEGEKNAFTVVSASPKEDMKMTSVCGVEAGGLVSSNSYPRVGRDRLDLVSVTVFIREKDL